MLRDTVADCEESALVIKVLSAVDADVMVKLVEAVAVLIGALVATVVVAVSVTVAVKEVDEATVPIDVLVVDVITGAAEPVDDDDKPTVGVGPTEVVDSIVVEYEPLLTISNCLDCGMIYLTTGVPPSTVRQLIEYVPMSNDSSGLNTKVCCFVSLPETVN